MSDEPAETFSAEAMRWVDGLSDPSGLRGSWRLQMLEHRVTVKAVVTGEGANATTEYVRTMRPVRLVRFAKGCPWALVPEAERYLLSLAPYTGKIVNGVDIPGTYKPTRTRWIRDDQTTLDDPRRSTNENRHTLVQDLVESSAADGDSVPQSEDCVETVTAEYHWDEPSLPDAVSEHRTGVTVSVQQVSRQEDGTYRYAIVTRTAKTRVGSVATVECTAFQSVTQQDFTNLYGDPQGGFVDEAGNEVEVPSQTCGTGGVSVEWRNLRQNDDCTWNVSVVTTAGTAVSDAERTSSETTVERRDTRKDTAQASPLQHVKVQDPATSTTEGHVWEQRSELRPDGLYDNTVTQRDEKQLASQVVETRRTVRGTTLRTVNRNMPTAAAAPSGLGTVTNTVTDSGRITQEIVTVDRNAKPVDAGSACSTTVFDHVESDRTIQPTKPVKHYKNAGGGHRYERSSRVTEEGSYEVTVEDHEELRKTGAKVTVRKTLRGTQRTVVDRNVASPLAETGLAIGETRDSEVTPGGLYVTSRTVTTAVAAGNVGTDCQKTVFEHVDSTTSNQASKPGSEATNAGGGKTYRKTARETEEGTWDVVTVTTVEKPQAGATKSWRKTLRGSTVTTVDRNAASALNGTGLKVGETRTSEKTPGGLYNNTRVVTTAEAAGNVGTDCQKTVFEHVDSTTSNQTSKPSAEATDAGGGKTYRKTARETEEGTWDVVTVTTVEKPQPGATKSWRKTLRGVQQTVVDRNQSSALSGSGLALGETRSSEKTPGGLYNNTVVSMSAEPVGEIGGSCERSATVHTDSTTSNLPERPSVEAGFTAVNVVVRNASRATDEGTWDLETRRTVYSPAFFTAIAGSAGRLDLVESGINALMAPGGRGGVNVETSVSISPNEHGSMSYTRQERTYSPETLKKTAGSVGYVDTIDTGLNVLSVPDGAGGKNEEVSLSMSLNEHGSYSYTRHKRKYNSTVETVVSGTVSHKDTVVSGINAQKPADSVGGTNEEVTISLTPNERGTFSYTKHTRRFSEVTRSASTQSGGHTEFVEVGVNSQSVPSTGDGAANTDASLSLSPNEHGTFSYTRHVRTYLPKTSTATSSFETESFTTVRMINNTGGASMSASNNGTASSSPNDHGSYTTEVTTYAPKAVDSGWLKWTSTVKAPHYTYKYDNGLRVFKNLSKPPTPPSGSNGQINASINRYGLYDGTVSYSTLKSWSQTKNSEVSGIRDGSMKLQYVELHESAGGLTAEHKVESVAVRHFYGSGNEGTEANTITHMYAIPGYSLPGRTYFMSSASNYMMAIEKNRVLLAKYSKRVLSKET